ncbi:phosphatidylinositol N-acetylglucosaminyltransferase [Metarhizium album ARSEF 1941]|uniref:Phosphatidylinositol N-acetylglucosaminyltransferase n=1 Tax=Metarhizium album (strain ARSEF 1941) TaxID=1081103 RepID=A0A0B2WSZ5_METAS|nr:phosphatidylinositol N-acetylglucosaminyltransferase [Metarhizium album ARSEF 1941]KHN99191.1 phosphatidylinositol N-acetylglucosaminyltransferase [Metarhizium album ARSEF 1941]
MITTTPRLRVRRPSPTTAEFTVTTLPPRTLSLRILRVLLVLARLVLALTTTLLLYGRWCSCPLAGASAATAAVRPPSLLSLPGLRYALDGYSRSSTALLLARIASSVPLGLLVPGAAAALYTLSLRLHSHESLLVLRGLGVQTTESPSSYLAGPSTRFIPTEKIRDIFVNEAFVGFQVRYYLVVVVEGEEDVVIVFPGLLPRRAIVETVWRGARECLYEAPKRDAE